MVSRRHRIPLVFLPLASGIVAIGLAACGGSSGGAAVKGS